MTTPKPPPSWESADPVDSDDEAVVVSEVGRIVHRPDGYHWQANDGRQEFGPFDSVELALADLNQADEEAPEPGETLEEAEGEIGMAGWIDPETGAPAEGQSMPRLEE